MTAEAVDTDILHVARELAGQLGARMLALRQQAQRTGLEREPGETHVLLA